VVRPSSKAGSWALSVQSSGTVAHSQISKSPSGWSIQIGPKTTTKPTIVALLKALYPYVQMPPNDGKK